MIYLKLLLSTALILALITCAPGILRMHAAAPHNETALLMAQQKWITFSPPSRSYIVEVPQELRPLVSPPESSDSENDLFRCAKSAEVYELPRVSEETQYPFIIGVFDVTACQCTKALFNEDVEKYLSMVGGDNKRIVSDKTIKIARFTAREVVYENGDLNGRLLVVNAKKRIYLLQFTTRIFSHTSSPEVLRMFRTFHPL